jgi:hypothetical protein
MYQANTVTAHSVTEHAAHPLKNPRLADDGTNLLRLAAIADETSALQTSEERDQTALVPLKLGFGHGNGYWRGRGIGIGNGDGPVR